MVSKFPFSLRSFLLVCVCIMNGVFTHAQTTHTFGCGSSATMSPADSAKRRMFDQAMQHKLLAKRTATVTPDTVQYSIPVVFHIVHQNGTENISDIDVQDAVRLLNQAFAEQIPFDPAIGVNIDIDFCLGGSTAITRHVSPLTNIVLENNDVALKQLGVWDPYKYINIWVVNSINSSSMGPGVAGYAMLPYAHGSPVDGIVIEAAFVNNNPDAVKVLVHEVGHYLGLYHTFEGGCKNDDCTIDGDRVCDTPPDNSIAAVQCANSVNTCTSDDDDLSANNPFRPVANGGIGDQPDMHKNYMDYGFQTCQNAFTDGQRTRMRDALRDVRGSLLTTPAACATCTNPITASLNLPPVLQAGMPYTFSVTSSATNPTVVWFIDGQVVGVAPTYTPNIDVAKTIIVKVYVIGSSNCLVELTDTVQFTCQVTTPTFTVNPTGLVSAGQTLTLTTANNGYTYTWSVDGTIVGTGATFNYPVFGDHGRLITLSASNGTCRAITEPYYLTPGNCNVSKENNTWYFGLSGGIDFNFNPPKAIVGKISTEEGCAVLCDANGAPIYHSNGESVGNSQTGMTLLNGGGLTGHQTTTQSALLVPMPGSNRYVYLFTVGPQAGDYTQYGGIYYSIIDKQGNGGNGEVIDKNHLMLTPVPEKVTAVKNFVGNGIWIISHQWNSNAFYAWPLTANGLGAPVISNVGVVHNAPVGSPVLAHALGELKASPSGNKLAVAIQGKALYEVFDFNNHTGVVSNPVTLNNTSFNGQSYGVAFSPDERYLYGSAIGPVKIVRFDLNAGGQSAIMASGVTISSTAGGSGGALQLAPNGKIYCARRGSKYLSVISNPNAVNPADCDFVFDGFKLASYSESFYGLPNPVQSVLISVMPSIIGPDKVCLNATAPSVVRYHFDPVGNATYNWIHKGPNAITVINDSVADVTFSTGGTDTLIVKRIAPCGDMYDTLYVVSGLPQPIDIGPDQLVCRGTAVNLDAGPGQFDYKWSNGTRTQTVAVTSDGKVKLEVITNSGCILKDSMLISYYALPQLNLGRDTSICTSETLTLAAPPAMDSYLWSDGSSGSSLTIADSGRYVVTVGKFGCLFKDTILIRKNVSPIVFAKDTFILCLAETGTIVATSGYDHYGWTLPSGATATGISIVPVDEGYYVLDYSNRCGAAKDSIFHFIPKFYPLDTIFTCLDTFRLISQIPLTTGGSNVSTMYNYTQHGDTMDIHRSGRYILVGYYYDTPLQSCLLYQDVHVYVDTAAVRPPLSINLGPDVSFCEGHVLPLNAGTGFESYYWNTGSHDSSTTVYGFGTYTVKARYCGFDYGDTIHITQDNSFDINLGPDKYRCPTDILTLDAGSGMDWYQWNNGQQSQQITVTGIGQFIVSAASGGCVARDTLNVFDAPTYFTITGDNIICAGESFTLSAGNAAGAAYVWDSLGVQTNGLGNTLLISEPGTYLVKNPNCITAQWSAPFTVNLEAMINPVFQFSPDSVCLGDSISISFNSASYSDYQWQDGVKKNPRTFISTASPVLTVSGVKCDAPFNPLIPLKNQANCVTALNPANKAGCDPGFYLTPNPGHDVVVLSSGCTSREIFKTAVHTAEGKYLASYEGDLESTNQFLNQLMPRLSPSMYVVKINNGEKNYHIKWVIIK